MDELPLDPRSIANYILVIRKHFGFQTTNLELQKLLYFVYGRFLIKYKGKLVEGYFEAWDHGPVHPLIYREFNSYGAGPILKRAESTDLITGEKRVIPPPTNATIRTHVTETVLQLRELTASQLRKKSHAPEGPWHYVWQGAKINLASQVIIPDKVIEARFNRHILELRNGEPDEQSYEDQPPEFNRRR